MATTLTLWITTEELIELIVTLGVAGNSIMYSNFIFLKQIS